MIDHMNPYKEPVASLQSNTPPLSRHIDWISIMMAVAVYVGMFVLGIIALVPLAKWEHWLSFVVDILCIPALPAAVGAHFLARRVHQRWAMHSVLYALVRALLITGLTMTGSKPNNGELAMYTTLWVLGTSVVIFASMAITRRLLKSA